jgi:hypothetical protein
MGIAPSILAEEPVFYIEHLVWLCNKEDEAVRE